MVIDVYLYPYSRRDAADRNELELWQESHQANVACKDAIEEAIRQNFDGYHLNGDCVQEVIQAFGYKRMSYVLANTLQAKHQDGRFSVENKAWGNRTYVEPDRDHNSEFVVDSHPAVLDGFVRLYRKDYDALGLYSQDHLQPDGKAMDYTGKVLIISPRTLKESYWKPEYQLWYAHDGFGCSPSAIGRSIRATCLADGECTRWNRADFLGPIQDELLPEWAKERLMELTGQQQGDGPAIGGMEMN